jgi:hypothetical protein
MASMRPARMLTSTPTIELNRLITGAVAFSPVKVMRSTDIVAGRASVRMRRARCRHLDAGHGLDEARRGRVLRVGQHREGLALLDDAAVLDHRDAVADFLDHGNLVGDQQDGDAELAVDLLEQRQDRAASSRGRAPRSPRRRAAPSARSRAREQCRRAASARRRARPDSARACRQADEIEQAFDLATISALGAPAISSGSATLSKTVREESRLKCWKIMPVRAAPAGASRLR